LFLAAGSWKLEAGCWKLDAGCWKLDAENWYLARRFADSLIRRFGDASMTELLYQTDSYLRVFAATVVAVDAENGRVALDRSAFYPGGGGQPNDLGHLTFSGATVPVTKVKKEGDLVWHWLSSSPLLAGEGLGVRSSAPAPLARPARRSSARSAAPRP